jgi:chloramphenicol 3-O phosphotransferase
LAVLWLDDTRSPALVAAVTMYERPNPFRPGHAGRVVVLNGPSSVGKSSLMTAFAGAATTPWACVDEPMFGHLAPKFLAWPATAGPVTEGFLAALAAAARVGNHFIVSSGGITQERFRDALVGVPTFYVGLQAPLAVLLERQLTQADKFGGLAEESVGIHAGWEYDLTIDTSSCRPAEAAEQLAAFLTDEFSGSPPSV